MIRKAAIIISSGRGDGRAIPRAARAGMYHGPDRGFADLGVREANRPGGAEAGAGEILWKSPEEHRLGPTLKRNEAKHNGG
jgi:hypothetical protein